MGVIGCEILKNGAKYSLFIQHIFNSPTWSIPKVHKEGLLKHRDPNLRKPNDFNRPDWHDNVVADFKYILDNDVVTNVANRFGIVSATGSVGTVLFFHASDPHQYSGLFLERYYKLYRLRIVKKSN